jgi:hypothetical protein
MEKMISCCGLNCSACEARIATINNDDELRKETAEKWRAAYNSPDITPEMINCTGCRQEGAKIGHWSMCQIRLCAAGKGFETCGECAEIDNCSLIKPVHDFSPDARKNLQNLN